MKLFIIGIFLFLLPQLLIGQSDSLQLLINDLATENDFNGTIIIKKENDLLYHDSFGLANRELNIANTDTTKYAIASITKLFTSVIILQLFEEGKINLENSIKHYLPDYRGDAKDQVSIHHLLTHTSGISNCDEIHTDSTNLPDIYIDEVSTEELLNKYCSGPLLAPVGSTFNYNNGDYIILGKIIEKLEASPFVEVLKNRILSPLEMNSTDLIIKSEDTKQLAHSYKWNKDDQNYEKDPERLFQNYYASGAMYSTSEDLMKFAEALFMGDLLKKPSINLLLRTYPETKNYGYGLWVRYPQYNKTVPKVAQRFGQIWGINTLLTHFIDQDITVIVLANTNKVYVSEFQNIVGEALFK